MDQLKVVVRFRDGRLLKGTTNNFAPEAPLFHLVPVGAARGDPPVRVMIEQLKAVFIVRDFEGNPNRPKIKQPHAAPTAYGKALEVLFQDGEVLVGSTLDYNAAAQGFFMFPADPGSNNRRIFVVNAAVRKVKEI